MVGLGRVVQVEFFCSVLFLVRITTVSTLLYSTLVHSTQLPSTRLYFHEPHSTCTSRSSESGHPCSVHRGDSNHDEICICRDVDSAGSSVMKVPVDGPVPDPHVDDHHHQQPESPSAHSTPSSSPLPSPLARHDLLQLIYVPGWCITMHLGISAARPGMYVRCHTGSSMARAGDDGRPSQRHSFASNLTYCLSSRPAFGFAWRAGQAVAAGIGRGMVTRGWCLEFGFEGYSSSCC